ncbi:putative N6-adenine methyltransferase-domain-containing protein [Mycena amicta]|nr:putative N6-adenine methyltransferase-domain-containing protein [Mycena amicta]
MSDDGSDRSDSPLATTALSDHSESESDSEMMLSRQTLSLLNEFIEFRTEQERRFNDLQGTSRTDDPDIDSPQSFPSVEEYRKVFAEDWQLSQFWCGLFWVCVGLRPTMRHPGTRQAFAERFAALLHKLCDPDTSIAFLCCPTAFVAFQHLRPLKGAKLLEVDGRFGVLAPKHFIHYDLEEPLALPDHLTNSVDIAVVDPPFLNEYTNEHLVTTLQHILRPSAKLFVITSTSVESVLQHLYDAPPLGPLRRTKIEVLHGQLRNDFGCWTSWEGSEELEW